MRKLASIQRVLEVASIPQRINVQDSDGYFVGGRFSVKAISPKFLVKNGL